MYRCHELSKSCMLVNPNLYKPPLQLQDARFVFTVRIFTHLIMHNYRSNQSALMTRCGTDFRHQYGIFGGKSQTSVSRNATRPGAKKDGCFRRLLVLRTPIRHVTGTQSRGCLIRGNQLQSFVIGYARDSHINYAHFNDPLLMFSTGFKTYRKRY